MTTSSFSHTPNSHHHLSRRASVAATAPYTIPNRQSQSNNHGNGSGSYSSSANATPFSPTSSTLHTPQQHQQHSQHQHQHQHHQQHQHQQKNKDISNQQQQQQQLSSSVPVLSREFVVRRISEGESGRLKEELKCEACGKGYKHVSSLAKHLWEHTPEWNVTKKLLISKHQQVQLLEAASILVSMNDIPSSPKSSVDVPPTINEESMSSSARDGSTSPVQFNPKYADLNNNNKTYPSSSAPRHTSPLNDTSAPTPSSNGLLQPAPDHVASSLKMRMNSISQVPPSSMNDALFGSSPAKFEAGSLHNNGGFLDVPKRSPTATTDKSSPKDQEDYDDDGVFGAMD